MRKRIVIGLLAVVVIGVVAFVLTRPKRGTVEWHKREYVAAKSQLYSEGALIRRLKRFVADHLGLPRAYDRMAEHEAALLRLGFLEERTVVVSNRAPSLLLLDAMDIDRGGSLVDRFNNGERFLDLNIVPGSNAIRVVTTRQDMRFWEEPIRNADVPKQEREQ